MKHRQEEWWGAEHVVLTFTAWAGCSNKQCGEEFAISGTGYVDQVPVDEEMTDSEYVNFFTPQNIHPPLRLFNLPANCPDDVQSALVSAFSLYWLSKPATAGRMRVALERLLDHLAVPSKTATGGFISLDQRIDHFSRTDATHGAQLMALKWLGNIGSHTQNVEVNDVLGAFEIFEHVLAELVGKRSAAVAALAAELTLKYKK